MAVVLRADNLLEDVYALSDYNGKKEMMTKKQRQPLNKESRASLLNTWLKGRGGRKNEKKCLDQRQALPTTASRSRMLKYFLKIGSKMSGDVDQLTTVEAILIASA